MKRMELGNTGRSLAAMALGCMNYGTSTPREEAFEQLDVYLTAGGDFLDTANCYSWWSGPRATGDESELLLGEWLRARKSRDRVFVATKAGARLRDLSAVRAPDGSIHWDRVRGQYQGLSAKVIAQACEESLRRLGIDTIDLYYAHIEDRSVPQEETLEAFQRLVTAGKVRHLACSNLRTWRLERARGVAAARGWTPYVAIQQEYSYLHPRFGADLGIGAHADAELLDYLGANRDVSLVAYSPLLKGIYADAGKRDRYYNWAEFDGEDGRRRWDRIQQVSARLGVSGNALVLAWLLHHQPALFVLIGPRTRAQLEECLAAAALRLDAETLAELARP